MNCLKPVSETMEESKKNRDTVTRAAGSGGSEIFLL